MTLREWTKKHGITPQETWTGGKMVTCDISHPGNGELYHITDHFVSSRAGPVFILKPSQWNPPRD